MRKQNANSHYEEEKQLAIACHGSLPSVKVNAMLSIKIPLSGI
jgi:hypothetical protein